MDDKIKTAAMEVVDLLRPKKLTITEVRDVLAYINDTIESNVRLE